MPKNLVIRSVVAFLLLTVAQPIVAHDGSHEPTARRKKRSDRYSYVPTDYRLRHKEYADTKPSKFALGFFASQDLSLLSQSSAPHTAGDTHGGASPANHHDAVAISNCPPPSRCHAGEDHSPGIDPTAGANGGSSTPVLSLKAGYQFTEVFSLFVGSGADFTSGFRDPALGMGFFSSLGGDVTSLLAIQATLPVSEASQTNSKLTTLTGSLGVLYSGGNFFVGGGGFVSGTFYRSPAAVSGSLASQPPHGRMHGDEPHPPTQPGGNAPTQPGTSPAPQAGPARSTDRETLRTGGNLYTGFMLTDHLSATVGAGAGTIYRESDQLTWLTDITVTRLGYSTGGIVASIAFSLLSPSAGAASPELPREPYIGFKLQYIFGLLSAVGILSSN